MENECELLAVFAPERFDVGSDKSSVDVCLHTLLLSYCEIMNTDIVRLPFSRALPFGGVYFAICLCANHKLIFM